MKYLGLESGHLFEVGTCLRLGAYLIFISSKLIFQQNSK